MHTDDAAIRDILSERDAALARGDAAAVVATTDPTLVSFDLQPPLRLIGEAARDTGELEAWFATWDGGIRCDFAASRIDVNGDLGVAYGLTRLVGRKRDGARVDSWFRSTFVLRRSGGDWRIMHDHHSFPMRMDGSNQVANDLTP